MTLVKICGLRTIEHAQAAAKAGADMLGFVFAPSKRRVTPEQAAAMIAAVRAQGAAPLMVGLFVNETPNTIAAIAELCGLDIIQLSGDEPIEVLGSLPALPIFKSVRLAGDPSEQGWFSGDSVRVTPHVDAHVPGSYGGTGMVADWNAAAQLARKRPILLAGGLSPANVGAAIAQVQPWAVDVSSGVEHDGQKDVGRIRNFVAAAHAATLVSVVS